MAKVRKAKSGERKAERPNWDEFFIIQALFYSTRGTCDRLHTACVLVKDKIIVGAGYNGSLPGEPHCDDVGHLMAGGHCVRTMHAEANAIRNCKDQAALAGATAYVIHTPCLLCLKALISYGVSRIVFTSPYDNTSYQWSEDEGLKTFVESLKHNKAISIEFLRINFVKLLQKFIDRLQGPGGALERLPKIGIH
ncbi:MAG: hypothetical protein A3G64_01765 [Candidatus Liptonbacteria bacterium RIFCSPLOWO2_12_FULL_60_15]|uniref:CMP/dCMP-type deaminase domain-containing protein n=2 Tax=Candidatus Liptoniibacteriota TaxID=1817909 RepID=A0A1G2CMV4_9BACT|nr:MAG: hypothetical protein A3E09_02460 [Candidatus Liptonbacteria bacterium RIFCSPHIGHO2_12_FULL_60_13]OGZ01971.1 MAG: hypothetical protein A3G64_01765 [Candidatus Liptonbacteria bacterium RIFCSPLOWO2_12_FULL_60_15]